MSLERAGPTRRPTSVGYLVFALDGARYALPDAAAKEVLRNSEPVPLPNAPPYQVGLVVHRTELLALVDPSRLPGGPSEGGGHRGPVERAVLVRASGGSFALAAEKVEGMMMLGPPGEAHGEAGLFAPAEDEEGGAVLLVDVERVLRFLSSGGAGGG